MPFRIAKRSMLKRPCILLLLVPVLACSGSETETSSPAAPTLAAPSTRSATFTLGGQVITSDTRAPIPEATVFLLNSALNGPDAGRTTTTDRSGNFSFTELQQSTVYATVSAVEYFSNNVLLSNETRTINLVPLGPVIQLSGRVTDISTSAAIAGATVYVNGRYGTTSDTSGNYNLTGRLDQGAGDITWASADGYEQHTRYILGNPAQSFRLRRIERILPGESWSVTVHPDDSLCFSNLQDPQGYFPGSANRCRSVRLVAQRDSMLQVEVVSPQDGSHPPFDLEVWDPTCCAGYDGNPASVKVTTGTHVLVSVYMPERSTTSQSFIVMTSMSP